MPTKDEMDSFWDIEKLVPGKKTLKPFAQEIKCTDYSKASDGSSAESDEGSLKLSFSEMSRDPSDAKKRDREYTPNNNKFIKSVKITHSLDRYDFYGNFRKAALIYHDYKSERCDYVPFYSYMPQYSQLSGAQKSYYFFWRSEVKTGRYPKTDYSYITLFVFEILNLSDKIPPLEGIRLLIELWKNYRRDFARADTDFGIWVEDYCLVHSLDAPIELVGDFIGDVISQSSLKEFWFSDPALMSSEQRSLLLCSLSQYDWRVGKYASSGKALYERHMLGAMGAVISDLWYGGEMLNSVKQAKSIRRTVFPRSICTHTVKCTLDIEYYSLSDSVLRDKITVAVRYCENKLRALMGVKSRLAVKDMDSYFAYIIDKYFASVYKAESERRKKASIPEYEKLYDAPEGEISVMGAMEIEESSWTTTARLVSEDSTQNFKEAEAIMQEPIMENITNTEQNSDEPIPKAMVSGTDRAFLYELLSGRTVKATLDNMALAERINEEFLEHIGDIVIEESLGSYTIIEDYREDIERILNDA